MQIWTGQEHNADAPANAIGEVGEAAQRANKNIAVSSHISKRDRVVMNSVDDAQRGGDGYKQESLVLRAVKGWDDVTQYNRINPDRNQEAQIREKS